MQQSPEQTPVPGKRFSILDRMVDGREFESLSTLKNIEINVKEEIMESLSEVMAIRGKPVICYVANTINNTLRGSTIIDQGDDLPFAEMVNSIPTEIKDIDIILVTPGGAGPQVSKFVDRLRPRFEKVSFIIPNIAMSAGTIFVTSGDEIIMTSDSYIGPIDPQVPTKQGNLVPAQALLTLLENIRFRGEENMRRGMPPIWTDVQIINSLDPKELGNAMSGSSYSIELVKDYLNQYKFAAWTTHSSTGLPVTDDERIARSEHVARLLCDHNVWKSHSRGIPREKAWEICKLKIIHAEDINGLNRAIKRFWALSYFLFRSSPINKYFAAPNYFLVMSDPSPLK